MTITIETNIPLPTRAKRKSSGDKYPELRLMNVGDSFLAPIKAISLGVHTRRVSKETGKAFVVRPEGTGARAWRKK